MWASRSLTEKCVGDNLPSSESKPQASHMIKLTPTEPVLTSRPEGDTNIPDPAIEQNENVEMLLTRLYFWMGY